MYGIYENGTLLARFVAPLAVDSNVPEFASDTLALKRVVGRRPGQRWEISARLVPLSVDAGDLFAMLTEKSHTEKIDVGTPQNYGVIIKRVQSGVVATAVGTKDASSVTVTNTGLIPRGCFVSFAGHDKVYMATGARSGNGTMGIFPKLRASVNGVMKWEDDVIMKTYAEMENIAGMAYVDGILMDLGVLRFVEAL
jgi:hypothetical protein